MKSKFAKSEVEPYKPSIVEKKWQELWEKNKIYSPNLDSAKKPFYNLMMFPYPSAEGMHVGNMYAFTGADVYGRFMRMQGFDVLEPIGLDGFGIHSENYAIKIGRHPKEQAKISEANFYRQLSATGNAFDWSRTVETYDPEYYKWTQWLFIQLFKAGLAYRKKAPVNFCPSCKTVLADEQVVKGQKNVGKTRHEVYGKDDVILGSVATPESKKETDSGQARMTIELNVCERCETEIEKRELEQWFFRITKYADRLLKNLDKLDWSEKVKIAQRSWIGKSEGAIIRFKIKDLRFKNKEEVIDVFTTRPDTLFGATFLVLSPEHPVVAEVLKEAKEANFARFHPAKLKEYVQQANKKTEQERIAERKDKAGVFSGLYAINPVNNEEIPIWIADYVLMDYGTGAIMGVPAHDERDFEFAKKYNLPIRQVISKGGSRGVTTNPHGMWNRIDTSVEKGAYIDKGVIVSSKEWDGWKVPDEIGRVIDWLEKKGFGKREVTYHLRDWLISRQRYWGPPIPMIYCEGCAKKGKGYLSNVILGRTQSEAWRTTPESGGDSGRASLARMTKEMFGWFPVSEKDLPVLLPDVKDWKPKGTGKSPLASIGSFVNTTCPNCKGSAKRETDVSDTFLDSSWYFLRYTSTDIDSIAFDIKRVKKWLPVKMYIGGAEHSVLHLLYSRFITMALYDLGFVDFEEPFSRFYAHGLLIKQGAKMSKSKGNVVIPDEYIKKYGVDTLRCYLMFLGPFSQGGDFYDTGIEGMHRFVKRLWRLFTQTQNSKLKTQNSDEGKRVMHKTIKKVTEDIAALRYNTAIASLMEWRNYISNIKYKISKIEIETFLELLAPFAPHMTEELWQRLRGPVRGFPPASARASLSAFGGSNALRAVGSLSTSATPPFNSIHTQPWPTYDPKFLEEQEVTIVVQVDGRVRDTIKSQKSKVKSQKYIEELARESEKIRKRIQGKEVKRVVYVEGKVVNFVTE